MAISASRVDCLSDMDIQSYMSRVGVAARAAARAIGVADTAQKDRALTLVAEAIERDATHLLEANAVDVAAARAQGLDAAAIDRLTLSEKGIAAMADGVRQIIALPDPVGAISAPNERPSGI